MTPEKSEVLLKAIENLAHAVSSSQGSDGTYLLEAAQELVEIVYPKVPRTNE